MLHPGRSKEKQKNRSSRTARLFVCAYGQDQKDLSVVVILAQTLSKELCDGSTSTILSSTSPMTTDAAPAPLTGSA